MAKNAPRGDNRRRGAVSRRSQFRLPSGLWAKRDTGTGRIKDVKTSGGPLKGVRREK